MALRLLTDEQIPDTVARQVRTHRPDISIESFHTWHDGAMRGQPDALVLAEAVAEGLTLITYDQRTIPPLLQEWADLQQSHCGVILVDGRSLPVNNIGKLLKALTALWDRESSWEWKDRIVFLKPAPPDAGS
jgi:predicted nuclease of predicted toxin-antitoxin system